jgi:2-dehydropantoate 2-reductase
MPANNSLRIAVLGGGGAMGGLFGGWLAAGGNDVTLIDVNQTAVDAINAGGVAIEEKDGTRRTYNVRAATDPSAVGPVDLILNFVKCYNTEAAMRTALPMLGANTAVLTLQNGWGNAARIADVVGEGRVLVGLTYHSATLLAPGTVKHPGLGTTYIGELDGGDSARLQAAAAALRGGGFETTVSPRILDEVWRKLALNVCTLPTAALLHFTADRLIAHVGTTEMMRGLLAEVVAVARAQGIALDFEERWTGISSLLQRAIGARASMLQDVEARRRTEIDVINGAIVAAGQEHGIATPLNSAMVWLVRSLEESFAGDAAKAA